ncbi:hypothetical protein [Mycetocola sp. 2940]|uniref:hypothetical protein n=1 Tax=Mycetocola sp. 2940 TaxID=3156452 RepID=UPI0033952D34
MTNPPQQPLDLAQLHQQGAVPHGYTVVGPAEPMHTNGPGLAAFVIGITAVVISFLPIVGLLAFALGPIGAALGIVGLNLANRPRRRAAWGIGLSLASMVIAFVLIFGYAFGMLAWLNAGVDEHRGNIPAPTSTP